MNSEPAYKCPVSVGDRVQVSGKVCLTSSAGGTKVIDNANIECAVTKAFWDWETGWRFWGSPADATDLAMLRECGTSEIGPDWYRANRPDDAAGLARAEAAVAAFDPSKVYFSEHDIAARPGIRLGR